MHNPELPVATAIAAVLVLIPVPTKLRVRNIPVLALLGGTFFVNVVYFVDTLVWAGNVRDVAPVWCDIATNIQFYFPLMAEGAALCIGRQIEWICSGRNTASVRPHGTLFEISVCFIIPLITIPIRYSLSSNRYSIMENLGCLPGIYPSKLAMALTSGPELLMAFLCFVFGCLAIRNIIRYRRSTFCNVQSLTTSHFVRLLAVCFVVGAWPLIAVLACFFYPVSIKLLPWRGWAAVHAHFSKVHMIPLSAQSPGLRQVFLASIWIAIGTGYLLFIILICNEDVQRDLWRVWLFVIRPARNFWQPGVAALARQPRALALGSPSKWFDSSTVSGSNGNELKVLVSASGGDGGVIAPSVKKAFIVSHHDRCPSTEGDLSSVDIV